MITGTLYVWPDGKMVLDAQAGASTEPELETLRTMLEDARTRWLTGEISLVVGPGITVQLADAERPVAAAGQKDVRSEIVRRIAAENPTAIEWEDAARRVVLEELLDWLDAA